MNNISPALHKAIADEVGSEKILWADSPDSSGYARRSWKSCLIGVPFTAFSLFWLYSASGGMADKQKSAPTFFILWGLMFVGFGLSMLLAPVFAMLKAERVAYVVTERRAIIFEKIWRIKIRSFESAALNGFERQSRGGSAGDIIFQRSIERRGRGTTTVEVGFLGLADFAPAEGALRAVLERAKQAPRATS
jgi:hypothetical protein